MSTRSRLAALVGAAALAVTAIAPAGTAAPAAQAVRTTPAASDRGVDPTDLGRWQVTREGAALYRVTWTSPRRLPVTSDRPTITGTGLAFGPTTGVDRRTVTAVVRAVRAPRPADLDVLLSGDRLDEAGSDVAQRVGDVSLGQKPPTTPLPATDPALPGPFSTVSSDYTRPGVKLPGMKKPIEMVGHVVEPAPAEVTGPRPLVLFMHGRHGVCYNPDKKNDFSDKWPCKGRFEEIPSQLGYIYIQNVLASQGYTTVSIRVNGINAQDYRLDDGGADARAQMVKAHLSYWTTIAAAHQADLSKTILVGHSRGGEGVDRASIEIPLSAPYKIVGQVLIAPTDFASHTAPYVPTMTLLPYCDGDVYDIQGQKFTDTARDLAADDTSLKSSVLVMGANHNFFNTEWTPGLSAAPSFADWAGPPGEVCGKKGPGSLSPSREQAVGKAYVVGAVKTFLGDNAYLPLVDGSHVTVASIGSTDVRSHAIGGGRDIRRPGIEATLTPASGGAHSRLCTGVISFRAKKPEYCGSGIKDAIGPHWTMDGERTPARKFFEMAWTSANAASGLTFANPLDLTSDRLELRTIVDAKQGPVDLRVRLTDGSAASVTLDPVGGRAVDTLVKAKYITKLWAQSLLVDASGAVGIDLADIRKVELVSGDPKGRVWVADLSAAPAALAPVPATRLPQVNLGDVKFPEGNPPKGTAHQARSAQLPFTITGTVTQPGKLQVVTVGERPGDLKSIVVNVSPGQTTGSIPVPYDADRLDDDDYPVSVQAWPLLGLATDDYLGRSVIKDDDPDPKLKVTAPAKVKEGRPVVFTVSLTHPSDDWFADLQVRPGPGREVQGGDVPLAFLKRFNQDPNLTKPLYLNGVFLFRKVKGGVSTMTFAIPTRADGRNEPPETLTVRIGAKRQKQVVTVTLVD